MASQVDLHGGGPPPPLGGGPLPLGGGHKTQPRESEAAEQSDGVTQHVPGPGGAQPNTAGSR